MVLYVSSVFVEEKFRSQRGFCGGDGAVTVLAALKVAARAIAVRLWKIKGKWKHSAEAYRLYRNAEANHQCEEGNTPARAANAVCRPIEYSICQSAAGDGNFSAALCPMRWHSRNADSNNKSDNLRNRLFFGLLPSSYHGENGFREKRLLAYSEVITYTYMPSAWQ